MKYIISTYIVYIVKLCYEPNTYVFMENTLKIQNILCKVNLVFFLIFAKVVFTLLI